MRAVTGWSGVFAAVLFFSGWSGPAAPAQEAPSAPPPGLFPSTGTPPPSNPAVGLPAPPSTGAPAAGAPPASGPAAGPPGSGGLAAGATSPVSAERASVARVTKGSGVLPNDHGQIWREYDISPYTARLKQVERPEQTIVDWILRETGTELWFSEPLGILSANRSTLRVYNTPDVQRVVAGIVDRFVHSGTETQGVSLRLATIGSPNWRTRAYPIMRSVGVQSPGIEAWLLSKENAAVLIADLGRRSDYRDHGGANLVVANGQVQNVTRTRPRSYLKAFRPRDAATGGADSEMGQIEEGFNLQISPLFSLDARSVDLFIKCQVDQVEKLVPVMVDVPAFGGQWQRSQVQVPQVVSWRLNEKFRWPTDQVLLLSCGVVASPVPDAKATGTTLTNWWSTPASRADALLFIECVGPVTAAVSDASKPAPGGGVNTRGRY